MVILSTEAPPTCCWKKLVDFSEWDEKVLKWHQSKLAGNINGLYICSSRKKVCHDQSPVFNCCCGCVGFLPWGRHVELMSCRINRSRGEVTSCSQVLLLFCPPPVCVNVTGYLTKLLRNKQLHVQIDEEISACPLQMAPRRVLEGYLYPATFRCVLMDYQKALINSAGWGLTVTLAPNMKVLEWFFPDKNTQRPCTSLHRGPEDSRAAAKWREVAWDAKRATLPPLKQDIVQFVLACEQTGGAGSQSIPGCADVHLGTSQPIRESGGECQPNSSSSCPLTARILPPPTSPANLAPPPRPQTPLHTDGMFQTQGLEFTVRKLRQENSCCWEYEC